MKTGAMMVVLIFMVGLFGVTSAVLGFIAEAEKLTPADIHASDSGCVYPANPAHGLAVCAIVLLAAAQITASVAGGGCGYCRPGGGASKPTRRVVGVVVSILSWVMAAIAGYYYWQGAVLNAPGTRDAAFAGTGYDLCRYLRGGAFVKAGVLSLVATSLAIKSCVLFRAAAATPDEPVGGDAEHKPDGQRPPEAGGAVGLPVWPAQGNGQAPYPQPTQGYGQARV